MEKRTVQVVEDEKQIVELLRQAFTKYHKDYVLKVIYEFLIADESERQAKVDFVAIAEKLLQIVYKYFQFRVREYTNQGVMFSHDVKYEKRWDGISMTIDLKFPKDQIMDLARWHEFIRLSKMSDAQVKKVALKRLDFMLNEREAGEVREVPKDRLIEKAEGKYRG